MFGTDKRADSTSPSDDETSSDTKSDVADIADGELINLVEGLEESPPLTAEICTSIRESFRDFTEADISVANGEEAFYGHPLSPEKAAEEMPMGVEGLEWNATIIPDAFFVDGKLRRGLNKKDFDLETKTIKPRRASIPVTAEDFFSSITEIDGPDGMKRYIFHGVLNGWPALQTLELIALEQKRGMNVIPSPKDFVTGRILWTNVWEASEEGASGIEPALQDHNKVHRAKLRAAPWSASGWSKDSPGYAFWFEAQRPEGLRVLYGTDLTRELGDSKCSAIHMISHRYARLRESPRDRLTYHSVCVLEWEHGGYCTVVESAYLNGMGGYSGRCKWSYDSFVTVETLVDVVASESFPLLFIIRQLVR